MIAKFPAVYGEAMGPLDVSKFPAEMLEIYNSDNEFRNWVDLTDKVHRAEKVSSWTQWTKDQAEAYKRGDCELFSRLRGYTETEIADFAKAMKLVPILDDKYGEGFCLDVCYFMSMIVETQEMRRINTVLVKMAEEEDLQRNTRD